MMSPALAQRAFNWFGTFSGPARLRVKGAMTTRFLSASGPTSTGLKRLGPLSVWGSRMGNSPKLIMQNIFIKAGFAFHMAQRLRETSDADKLPSQGDTPHPKIA